MRLFFYIGLAYFTAVSGVEAQGVYKTDSAVTKSAPPVANEEIKDCSRAMLQGGSDLENVAQKVLEDSKADPAWPGQREVPKLITTTLWSQADGEDKRKMARWIVSYQYCTLMQSSIETVDSIFSWHPDFGGHCGNAQELRAWLQKLEAATHFSEAARLKYPYGAEIANLVAGEGIEKLQQNASNYRSEYELMRLQCEYAQARLTVRPLAPEKTFMYGVKGVHALDKSALDKYFDNKLAKPASFTDNTGVGRAPSTRPQSTTPPVGTALKQKGLKVEDVPLETYESLTEGVLLEFKEVRSKDGPRIIGSPEDERRLKIFQQALRHLYDIPRGRQVLREVQEMRGDYEKVLRDQAARGPETLKTMKEELAEDERAEALVREGKLDSTGGRDSEERRKEIAGMESFLQAAAVTAKPTILVAIGGTDVMEGGHAEEAVIVTKDNRILTRLAIAEDLLKDSNPSRAIDKVLSHELQHMADKRMMSMSMGRQFPWQLVEDRAYLTEARAVMEQLPALAKEKKSERVEMMKSFEVAEIMEDPTGFRLRNLSSPLYLWHITPADLNDPETALHSRLAMAWKFIASSDDDAKSNQRRSDVFRRIDSRDQMKRAFERAISESPLNAADQGRKIKNMPDYDSVKAEAKFMKLAAQTDLAKEWLADIKAAAKEMRNPPESPGGEWMARFQKAEKDFWPDLESFVKTYRKEP